MDTELLIIDDESEIIIEVDTDVEVLEAAAQGPRGPQGIPGPPGKNGDGSGALLIDNRLNEFAGDTAAQEQAQANLGLGVADPLAYYILAKS